MAILCAPGASFLRIGFALAVLAGCCLADTPASGADGDLYSQSVNPVLEKNCTACHGAKVKQSGLDLSSAEGLLRGGDSGPVIIPGKANESKLYKLISFQEAPGMPFKGKKLPDESIARIAAWINAGAPLGKLTAESASTPKQSDHWAFRAPKQPSVPEVKNKAWVRNPIDAFIAKEQEKRGLKPLPEADRRTLLRRVYLDLIGLPPNPEEIQAFLADGSATAYEKVVDALLASPRYGERWGRHWMDIWRYSDWYGWRKNNEVRYSQPHIWQWRDWIIESLNQDKGYGEMIREMLAGDEVAPADPGVGRATGYLARNWYKFNRSIWIQDTSEYTAAAFLGLTMKCARCHSHKYDPITQVEYYRFRAFFEPIEVRTDRIPGQPDKDKIGLTRMFDAYPNNPTYRLIRGDDQKPDMSAALTPGIPEVFGKVSLDIKPVALPRETYYPDSRPFVYDDLIAQAKAEIERAKAGLTKAKDEPAKEAAAKLAEKKLAAAQAALPALEARIAAERAKYSTPPLLDSDKLAVEALQLERKANVLKADAETLEAQMALEAAKGDSKKTSKAKKSLEDAVAALGLASNDYTPIGPSYPETSTGRRTALAQWITGRDNPLTARVAINHIWLRHFGKALVPTVFNFGMSGKTPTHPELLDWLATEFMDKNWSMKSIHRLIVTSSAYRMRSSGGDAQDANTAIDPDNKYLWRMNVKRMESEVVRDAVLLVAGKLDTAMGGPDLDVKQGQQTYRRSVYFRHAPDTQMEFLRVFDAPNPNECFQRSESIVPHQALALANSELALDMSRVVARTLPQGDASKFVSAAFVKVLGRPASAGELADSVQFLKDQAGLFGDMSKLKAYGGGEQSIEKPATDPDLRAREDLVHVLLNHNDFVTIR
jgi:hypothetical protein